MLHDGGRCTAWFVTVQPSLWWCGIRVDGEHSIHHEPIQMMEITSTGTDILVLEGEMSLPGFFCACHSLSKRRHGSPRVVHSGMLPARITDVVLFLFFSK